MNEFFINENVAIKNTDWYPAPEEYDPKITKQEWVALIRDENIFDEHSLITFACIQNAAEPSCAGMAEEFGRHYNFYNTNISTTGNRVYKKMHCPLPSSTNQFWAVCCLAQRLQNGRYAFKIRPELQQAFEETQILKGITLMTNENVNYWIIMHTYDKAEQENINDLISQALENNYAFMQYEYKQHNNFQEPAMVTNIYNRVKEIKAGDYIFLRGGDVIYAYGKAIYPRKMHTQKRKLQDIINNKNCDLTSKNSSDIVHFNDAPVFYFDFSEGEEGNKWGQRIDVDNWIDNDIKLNKPNSSDYADSNTRCPIRKLKEKSAKRLIEQFGGKITMPQNTNPYKNEIELLRFKKNIILQGAPGTGKTYGTASIALGILGDDSVDYSDHESIMQTYKKYCDDGRIGFVTFHQSMDYEDFVEGLKPEIIGDEQKCVNYKIEDGIFKRMCRNAEKKSSQFFGAG